MLVKTSGPVGVTPDGFSGRSDECALVGGFDSGPLGKVIGIYGEYRSEIFSIAWMA